MEKYTKAAPNYELQAAGVLLSSSALLIAVTIFKEANAGWTSLWRPLNRSNYEAGKFLYEHWEQMNSIWSIALIAAVLTAIASLLLFKNTHRAVKFPYGFFWALLFAGSLCLILSFCVTLGGYYPALEVLDEQPSIFNTIRGVALYLFNLSSINGLVLFTLFLVEGLNKRGIIPFKVALILLIVIIVSLLLMIAGIIPSDLFTIISCIVPFLLGIYYWKSASGLNLPNP